MILNSSTLKIKCTCPALKSIPSTTPKSASGLCRSVPDCSRTCSNWLWSCWTRWSRIKLWSLFLLWCDDKKSTVHILLYGGILGMFIEDKNPWRYVKFCVFLLVHINRLTFRLWKILKVKFLKSFYKNFIVLLDLMCSLSSQFWGGQSKCAELSHDFILPLLGDFQLNNHFNCRYRFNEFIEHWFGTDVILHITCQLILLKFTDNVAVVARYACLLETDPRLVGSLVASRIFIVLK